MFSNSGAWLIGVYLIFFCVRSQTTTTQNVFGWASRIEVLHRKWRWRMVCLSSAHTRYHHIFMSTRGPKSCELLHYPLALCVNRAQEAAEKIVPNAIYEFKNNRLIVPEWLKCRLNYIHTRVVCWSSRQIGLVSPFMPFHPRPPHACDPESTRTKKSICRVTINHQRLHDDDWRNHFSTTTLAQAHTPGWQ